MPRKAKANLVATMDKPPLHRSHYSIADVASFINVSAATIRVWEREGLLKPQRTSGKHRLYTKDDLERADRIRYLRRVTKMNAASIRRELGPAKEPISAEGAVTATDPKLGRRLRAARLECGFPLAEASRLTGLSVSFLSAVELGQSGIALVNLYKLAEAYRVTIAGLQNTATHNPQRVLRPGSRPRYVVDNGRVAIEDLISSPGLMRATLLEIAPGGESGAAYSHGGEEFVYVLEGHVGFWIGKHERYDLSTGETLRLESVEPHRWRNLGGSFASLLWVNVLGDVTHAAPIPDPPGIGGSQRKRLALRGPTAPRGGSKVPKKTSPGRKTDAAQPRTNR